MKKRTRKFRYLPTFVLTLVTLSVGGGAIAYIRNLLSTAPAPQKQVVQVIQVIRPPPPPPDLPPPPPPPPEEKVDVSEPEQPPDPTPSNEPPPGDQLGLDAEGTAGGDAFGLEGRKGGRELLGTGGSAFAWYAGILKDQVLAQLSDDARLRRGAYSVVVKLWVKDDGTVERVQLAQSTGDRDRDRAIETALARITHIAQAPPAEMPQPVSLRIVSRV